MELRAVGSSSYLRPRAPAISADAIGLLAGTAVLIGAALPWTTASYLDDIKTRTGTVGPAVLETAVAGAVIIGATAAHINRALSGRATALVCGLAAGIVTMGLTDVFSIAVSTGGSSGPWHLGTGFGILLATVPLLAVYSVMVAGRGRRLLVAAFVIVVLVVSAFIGLVAGDATLNEAYDYSSASRQAH